MSDNVAGQLPVVNAAVVGNAQGMVQTNRTNAGMLSIRYVFDVLTCIVVKRVFVMHCQQFVPNEARSLVAHNEKASCCRYAKLRGPFPSSSPTKLEMCHNFGHKFVMLVRIVFAIAAISDP